MPDEAKSPFDDARTQLNDYLDSYATIVLEDGPIPIRNLANIIIYGGLAHSNKRKSLIFESWMNSGAARFFWAEFFAYAREMLSYFRYFRDLNEAVIKNLAHTRDLEEIDQDL